MAELTALPDPWLTQVMARPVSRVSINDDHGGRNVVSPELERSLRSNGFIYAKVPISAVPVVQALEDLGFRFVDVAVGLAAGRIDARPANESAVRLARSSDVGAVTEIARTSFVWSRFHQDPQVPKVLADDIKAAWAGNFFRGERGDAMVVAEVGGGIGGFLQLLRDAEGWLVIDLIAVAERARGRGFAAAMIALAKHSCGVAHGMRVGTQLANRASLRLYERLGFRQVTAGLVLHRHQAKGIA